MAESKEKMPLPKIASLDDLFTTQEQRDETEKVINISIDSITDFPDHPFKVLDNEKMNEMVESIKERGVIYPAIVRKKENGKYEMISGHRRKHACELANTKEMPCIVRDLTDEEAVIYMVDSNIQREEILPSEKAFAYKMKLEAMNKQAGRPKNNLTPVVSEKRTNEIVGAENGDSREQVRRYIRLTELIPEILDLVDEKRVAFRPAVEISYLSDENQYALLNIIEFSDITPSLAQAIYMKKAEQENRLTTELIEDIMGKEKANQIPKIKLNEERFERLLPNSLKSTQEKEDFIFKCVEFYVNRQRNKNLAR